MHSLTVTYMPESTSYDNTGVEELKFTCYGDSTVISGGGALNRWGKFIKL